MNRNKITEENWEMQISKKVFKNNEAVSTVSMVLVLLYSASPCFNSACEVVRLGSYTLWMYILDYNETWYI